MLQCSRRPEILVLCFSKSQPEETQAPIGVRLRWARVGGCQGQPGDNLTNDTYVYLIYTVLYYCRNLILVLTTRLYMHECVGRGAITIILESV